MRLLWAAPLAHRSVPFLPAAVAVNVCPRSCSTGASLSVQQPSRHYRTRTRPWRAAMPLAAAEQPQSTTTPVTAADKTKVLFVCLGNICRSPSAEAVFNSVIQREGVADQFEVDSCGTGGGSRDWYKEHGFSYHTGNPSDQRMSKAAAARGVTLTSVSRPLVPEDLSRFDYIVAMDAENVAAIQVAADHWAGKGMTVVPANYGSKISLMTSYLQSNKFKQYKEVPDPYFGGAQGFELVLDLLEDACEGLLAFVVSQRKLHTSQKV